MYPEETQTIMQELKPQTKQIHIIKRSGKKEPLNIDKTHFVVEQACEGLSGVSSSQIEMNSGLQFSDGMTSQDIQDILIRSANDLISLDAPNYQYAAARLLLWGVRKDVFGKFETTPLLHLIKKNIDNREKGLFLKDIMNIDNQNLITIGKDYINQLNNLSNNSKKVTDKLPINFKWIGFIKLILPNCKIVHCVRNSKDNCLSIFRNYFTNPELNFAYDLKEIISFYNFYYDLMKHWKKALPQFIIDIKYENLVNNPKEQIYELLKRCNLKWDPNCLNFHNNKRPIKTASDTQARKKIYKGSINSWKNYEKDLKLLFRKLPD